MRSEVHKDNSDKPLFSHILAEIYVGLTDDEALRLASHHIASSPGSLHGFTGNVGAGRQERKRAWYEPFTHARI